MATLHFPLLQLSSVLNVLKRRKWLELLAFSALLNFEEINLTEFFSLQARPSPCRNSTWVAARIRVNGVIIVH